MTKAPPPLFVNQLSMALKPSNDTADVMKIFRVPTGGLLCNGKWGRGGYLESPPWIPSGDVDVRCCMIIANFRR